MYDFFWRTEIRKYNAVKVKLGILRRGDGKLPKPSKVPDQAIWFETRNFGWILSPLINGKRRILLQY